ncbi:hypothetical protein TrRE_jg2352 [Triparma retinervis]|uniref:Calmodulin n=1 Tax=Triparma retinervis TaxID=2557542 RepID=A0A9W7ASC0_9STRA|nr:hypothetical protein TrRE_jg2352 [Triparma retinervis]
METLTGNQTSELEDIFNKVANETGTGDERVLVISAKQLGFILRSMGVFSSESEIRDMISEVDTTGSGTMAYEEFANLMCRSIKAEAEPFEEITDAFDEIGDGMYVTKENLLDALRSIGQEITEEETRHKNIEKNLKE